MFIIFVGVNTRTGLDHLDHILGYLLLLHCRQVGMERGRQLEQPPTVIVLHGVEVHLADDQVDADHQVT